MQFLRAFVLAKAPFAREHKRTACSILQSLLTRVISVCASRLGIALFKLITLCSAGARRDRR